MRVYVHVTIVTHYNTFPGVYHQLYLHVFIFHPEPQQQQRHGITSSHLQVIIIFYNYIIYYCHIVVILLIFYLTHVHIL